MLIEENNRKKYTQCKYSEEDLRIELDKYKSGLITMEELTSITGVCKKQLNNYIKNGVNLQKGHGSQKPYSDETVYKIMRMLSEGYSQAGIRKELNINKSTLSNQCKVLTFVSHGCYIQSTWLGYNVVFEICNTIKHGILYMQLIINGNKIERDVLSNIKRNEEYNKFNNEECDNIRDIIMNKASKDYFYYIPIKPTMELSEEERLEKYKEFYKRIINEIDDEDIYPLLKRIIDNQLVAGNVSVKVGGKSFNGNNVNPFIILIMIVLGCIDDKSKVMESQNTFDLSSGVTVATYKIKKGKYITSPKKKNINIQSKELIPSHTFVSCVFIEYLLILFLLYIIIYNKYF